MFIHSGRKTLPLKYSRLRLNLSPQRNWDNNLVIYKLIIIFRRWGCNNEHTYSNLHKINTSTLTHNHTHTVAKPGPHFPLMFTYQTQEWRRKQKGLMGTSRPDDVVVIALVTLVIKNQFVACLFIVLSKSQLNNLLGLIHRWWKCKTGIIEAVFLRSSRHTGVASCNPTADRPRTVSEFHQDNLNIRHFITALGSNNAAGGGSDRPPKITLHVHSGTAGQQFSAKRMRQKVSSSHFENNPHPFIQERAEYLQRCQNLLKSS